MTSFQSQLRVLAASSSHELNLRARRTAHSDSLLFSTEVAVKQDFDTIYDLCLAGFQELCRLDGRFNEFGRNLFSPQAKDQDRELMNASENEALDRVIERCLRMLGAMVLIAPGTRALEWLIRRFRIHTHNTAILVMCVLPYHEMPIWRNVMQILPSAKLVGDWKWIMPYKKDALNVPRSTVVFAMTNNNGFFAKFNQHVIQSCRDGIAHEGLLRYWATVVVESVIGRMNQARSGRQEIERQKIEDVLLKVLPVLTDGFSVRDYPELTKACFTLAMVVAAKGNLDDSVLDSLIQAVADAFKRSHCDAHSMLVTTAIIISKKRDSIMPKAGIDAIMSIANLDDEITTVMSSSGANLLIESLIRGVLSMGRKKIMMRLPLIKRLLINAISWPDKMIAAGCLQAVIDKIITLDASDPKSDLVKTNISEVLRQLVEEDARIAPSLEVILHSEKQSKIELETLIGSRNLLIEAPPVADNVMDIEVPDDEIATLSQFLAAVPASAPAGTHPFGLDRDLFAQLVEVFNASCKSNMALSRFSSLPLWSSFNKSLVLLYTFLIQVATGPYSTTPKAAALNLITTSLKQRPVDAQVLLPYVLSALTDQARSIRRAAAELIVAIGKAVEEANVDDPLGKVGFYRGEWDQNIHWIPSTSVSNIVRQAFLPALEECVMDPSQVARMIKSCLNGASQGRPEGFGITKSELKKSLRHDLFGLLTSHAVATPLWKIKATTIRLLEDVHRVGSTTTTKALAPIFESWNMIEEGKAQAIAEEEQIDLAVVDNTVLRLLSAADKDKIEQVLINLGHHISARTGFITALCDRIVVIWPKLKGEIRFATALRMFESSFGNNDALAKATRDMLQSVELSTEILGGILEQSTHGLAEIQTSDLPKKRRRTSYGRENVVQPEMGKASDQAVARLTLALEVVDSSQPERHVDLVSVLFDTLAILRRLRQQRPGTSYLVNLCLTSILAIVDRQRLQAKPSIPMSIIRADLVTECIRVSDNAQVQNTALLLSASLAVLSPDQMLHNIMPVFTFMGQTMFAREDQHSMNILNQCVDQVVPAIVNSLRLQSKDLVKSTSGLLSSFATAYNHIPSGRRVAIYNRLLDRMGAADFAFILLAMLGLRNSLDGSFRSFVGALLDTLPAPVQLGTYVHLIQLADDIVSQQPSMAPHIIDMTSLANEQQKKETAKILNDIALDSLGSKSVKESLRRVHRLPAHEAESLRREFNLAFEQTLASVRLRKQNNTDVTCVKQGLDNLLALPPLTELLISLPDLLRQVNLGADLKPQVLRVVASQLSGNPAKDSKTRQVAISLLEVLTRELSTDPDNDMKQAIIVTIDRIIEEYGRKATDSVLAAAKQISGDTCLGSKDRRIRIMSLLCLASMMEVLRQSSAPAVSEMLARLAVMLKAAAQDDDVEFHNAAFALVSAIATHVPFLISDDDLQEILNSASGAANSLKSVSARQSRVDAMGVLAGKIDTPVLLSTLLALPSEDTRKGIYAAELEKLQMISTLVEAATKSSVVGNADAISQLVLTHMDLIARSGWSDDQTRNDDIKKAEELLNEISIQYIYKLNDATFRPVFETWSDWATNAHDLPAHEQEEGKVLRQIGLFHLQSHFFSTLKSIVTSYASYVIPLASTILDSIQNSLESRSLHLTHMTRSRYTSLLDMLQAIFTHDADSFFSAPAHFSPLGAPLIAQLALSSSKQHRSLVTSHVIPTIVALAGATADTPAHHQTLAHHLTALRRSSSAATRLASIQTLNALTVSEEAGDEFLANTLGVGVGAGTDGDAGTSIARGGGSSAGELMIYVNEMLEDDDEEVEMTVRRWIQRVREMVGEDVFEV